MALEAATKALLDAGITYDAIEHAYVGYVYGDSTCGQSALYGLGLTGTWPSPPPYLLFASTGLSGVSLAHTP